jgi:hypothetical protein
MCRRSKHPLVKTKTVPRRRSRLAIEAACAWDTIFPDRSPRPPNRRRVDQVLNALSPLG